MCWGASRVRLFQVIWASLKLTSKCTWKLMGLGQFEPSFRGIKVAVSFQGVFVGTFSKMRILWLFKDGRWVFGCFFLLEGDLWQNFVSKCGLRLESRLFRRHSRKQSVFVWGEMLASKLEKLEVSSRKWERYNTRRCGCLEWFPLIFYDSLINQNEELVDIADTTRTFPSMQEVKPTGHQQLYLKNMSLLPN